jgi:CRISPR type IV-associated protein Csf3
MFDGLMGWVLGIEHKSYCNKSTEEKDIIELPIPLEKEYFDQGQGWFYKCSNPVYKVKNEWIERWAKRTDVHKVVQKVEKYPKSISSGSGKYKQYYAAMNCKDIQVIKYFAVGDKTEIERILNKIVAIGNKRSYGYGFIAFWEVNEIDQDYSVCYDLGEQGKMLMKTIPECYLKNIKDLALQNLRKEWGRYKLPYWYPTVDKVIVPC